MVILPKELTTDGHSASRRAAERILTEYVRGFCAAELVCLARQQHLRHVMQILWEREGVPPEVEAVELTECARLEERLRRMSLDPRPHAERELRRLIELGRELPTERLLVSARQVRLCLNGYELEREGNAKEFASFDICLPAPESKYFPIYVRSFRGGSSEAVFIQLARHGACRGNSAGMLEAAAEQVALCDLVVIALSWARRNLP